MEHTADSNGPRAGYGRTLRIISVLGGASVISVALGVIKVKVAALILGPGGIAIIALLQNAIGVATTLGDAGMRQSGAREISRELASEASNRVRLTVSTLTWMGLGLGLATSLAFFALRHPIARDLLDRPDLADDLGWATFAVAATVIAAALTAMLNGHHRVREITLVTIYSALYSCVISVAAIWLWGRSAIVLFVVSAPILLMAFSLWYVIRMGAMPRLAWPGKRHLALAAKLLKLGVYVMLSAIVLSVAELTVRLAIQRETNLTELGLFSAAWAIGVYYLNFLMVATSTEFFPRLSARFDQSSNRNETINHQIQALCIVAAPVVMGLSAFCPLVLRVMYSASFLAANDLVRLMVIGDVLRLSIYPLGFVLIAASRGPAFFGLKLVEALLFAGLSAVLLPRFGLRGVGFAHIATFGILFAAYALTLGTRLGFRLSLRSLAFIGGLLAVAVALAAVAAQSELGAFVTGGVLLAGWVAVATGMWLKQRAQSKER